MPSSCLGSLRILAVDNEPDQVDILCRLLTLYGHKAAALKEPSRTLATASQFRPDVILLDTVMPHQDGNEIARILRSDPAMDSVIIIAISGHCRESDRVEALASGADGFLPKPFTVDQLHQVIAEARTVRV